MWRIVPRRLIAKFVASLLRGVSYRRDLGLLLLLLLLPERHTVITVRVPKLVEEREGRRGSGGILVVEGRAGGGAGGRGEVEGTPSWRDHGGVLQADRVRWGPGVLREAWNTGGRLRLAAHRRRNVTDVLLLLLLLLALPTLLRLRRRGCGARCRRVPPSAGHGQYSLTVLRSRRLQALKKIQIQLRGSRGWATGVS